MSMRTPVWRGASAAACLDKGVLGQRRNAERAVDTAACWTRGPAWWDHVLGGPWESGRHRCTLDEGPCMVGPCPWWALRCMHVWGSNLEALETRLLVSQPMLERSGFLPHLCPRDAANGPVVPWWRTTCAPGAPNPGLVMRCCHCSAATELRVQKRAHCTDT